MDGLDFVANLSAPEWRVLAGCVLGLLAVGIPVLSVSLHVAAFGIDLVPPFPIKPAAWRAVTSPPSEFGGLVQGVLDRLIFFAAILFESPEAVAAWLAFKVASKWEVWGNLVQVPRRLEGVEDIDFLVARHSWGSFLLTRFIVGTGTNLVLATIAVVLAGVAIPHAR